MDGFEESLAGLLKLVRRLVVADLESELVEYFKLSHHSTVLAFRQGAS